MTISGELRCGGPFRKKSGPRGFSFPAQGKEHLEQREALAYKRRLEERLPFRVQPFTGSLIRFPTRKASMDSSFFENLSFGWRDAIDIGLITVLFYNVIVIVKQTRAVTAIYGLVILIAAYFVTRAVGLTSLNWILENILSSLFLLVVIVFQRDIRQGLSSIGAKQFLPSFFRKKREEDPTVKLVCDAALTMAARKIGALMVLERNVPLGDVTDRGVRLDALLSRELLISLFWPNSPLHDGAALIAGGRIVAGGCILPLSSAATKRDYGTRHRAALGITEETDAVVIVVSEERGVVSLALDGRLTSALDAAKLPRVLTSALEKRL